MTDSSTPGDEAAIRAVVEHTAEVVSGVEREEALAALDRLVEALTAAQCERDEALTKAWQEWERTKEAEAQVESLRAALTGCVQSGMDEDGNAWIAASPSGVDEAARILGLTAKSIREAEALRVDPEAPPQKDKTDLGDAV